MLAQGGSRPGGSRMRRRARRAGTSSGDFFRFDASRHRSARYHDNLFDPLRWEPQRQKGHRPSDSARTAPRVKAKSKPDRSESATTKKPDGIAVGAVEDVPLPRPRPTFWPEPHTFAEAAGPGFDSANVTSALSDCDQRLAAIAAIELLPRLIGPGDCGGRDMIRLEAVLLPNRKRVDVRPTAVLRCAMAESFAAWVRDEASDHLAALGDALRSVETFGSYECRGRNSIADAKLSEHGKGNAIDLRTLVLANGRHIEFTDETASKPLRDGLRDWPVIVLRPCWDRALTAITITTSISTFSNDTGAPVSANGMFVSRLPRPKSHAGVHGWPPDPRPLRPGRQRAGPSPRAPGQSDQPIRQTSCKAAP